jgi:AcrR family transcriptional regulator
MPRVKQRTPALRDHVVDVAVQMLRQEGVADFTARKVAARAGTSAPAVYELFGDKSGLLREVFFEGFRLLGDQLGQTRPDLVATVEGLRAFVLDNPVLADVMFSRPFASFTPGPDERTAGDQVRELIVGRVQRAVDAGELVGDATDIAHALLALALGLAGAEAASRLGTTKASIDRRWSVAVAALLDGFSRQPRGRSG